MALLVSKMQYNRQYSFIWIFTIPLGCTILHGIFFKETLDFLLVTSHYCEDVM